ncbi:MAG: hypothetical protein ACI8R4_000699 [Paracoccaceae bacterium]
MVVGDSFELDIEIYAADLQLLSQVRSGRAIARILRAPTGGYPAAIIGGAIGQTELLLGLLIEFAVDKAGQMPAQVNRLVRRLHRPG